MCRLDFSWYKNIICVFISVVIVVTTTDHKRSPCYTTRCAPDTCCMLGNPRLWWRTVEKRQFHQQKQENKHICDVIHQTCWPNRFSPPSVEDKQQKKRWKGLNQWDYFLLINVYYTLCFSSQPLTDGIFGTKGAVSLLPACMLGAGMSRRTKCRGDEASSLAASCGPFRNDPLTVRAVAVSVTDFGLTVVFKDI